MNSSTIYREAFNQARYALCDHLSMPAWMLSDPVFYVIRELSDDNTTQAENTIRTFLATALSVKLFNTADEEDAFLRVSHNLSRKLFIAATMCYIAETRDPSSALLWKLSDPHVPSIPSPYAL